MLKLRARNKNPCCPLCRVELLQDNRYACSGCDTVYHRDCADELGGCGTLGCRRMGVKPDAPTPDDQRFRERARRRVQAQRARRTSARRMRAAHRSEGASASWSFPAAFAEVLFHIIGAILSIVFS